MASLRELHVWRDKYGVAKKVEFVDGESRMEAFITGMEQMDKPGHPPHITVAFSAKPIYHEYVGDDD